MITDGPASDWPTDVISFLTRNLPDLDHCEGWDHMFSSAYQIGCEALTKLGHADETTWGAVPRKNPQLPNVLPRWDDICAAVLGLAHQQSELEYRLPDGSVPPQRVGQWILVATGAPPPPAPNISAGAGSGPAHATPETLLVFQTLGLIADNTWTDEAELVLWRKQPREWKLEFTHDPRFAEAVERAIRTIPHDIRGEIDRLVTITDEDVEAAVALYEASREELREKYGPNARIGSPTTTQKAKRSLTFQRECSIDWLFFRRWRLSDGWLTPKQATRALGIFHDPLAIAMRRSVIERCYPDAPMASH